MVEGYTPHESELLQEQMGITTQELDHGTAQLDAEGRVVLRTEQYDNTQVTQITHGEDGSSVEHGKIIEGEKQGQEYKREHPHTTHSLALHWSDPELGEMNVSAAAVLETVGETTAGGPAGTNEPWAHFESTDPTLLEALANVRREEGKSYAVLNAGAGESYGGGFDVAFGSRRIAIESIRRISIDFGPDGMPSKATLHKIHWTERSPAETE